MPLPALSRPASDSARRGATATDGLIVTTHDSSWYEVEDYWTYPGFEPFADRLDAVTTVPIDNLPQRHAETVIASSGLWATVGTWWCWQSTLTTRSTLELTGPALGLVFDDAGSPVVAASRMDWGTCLAVGIATGLSTNLRIEENELLAANIFQWARQRVDVRQLYLPVVIRDG